MKKNILFLTKKSFKLNIYLKDKECRKNCKLVYKWTNPAKTKENYGLRTEKCITICLYIFLEKENRQTLLLESSSRVFFF